MRLAREALAGAQADALARGSRPAHPATNHSERGIDRDSLSNRPAGRDRREDPQPLTAALDGLIGDQGWARQAATGSMFGRWGESGGAGPGAPTKPDHSPYG